MKPRNKKKPVPPAVKGTMRKFRVRLEGEMEIEVADELLKSCNTDEWRAQMFQLKRDEEFVEHIAGNMIVNGLQLHSIDGYADQPKGYVKLGAPWLSDWAIDVKEIK